MEKYDTVVLTAKHFMEPERITPYVQKVLTDDSLIVEALRARGLKVIKTNWDNPDFDWSSTRTALFRTIWDYFERFQEFNSWLEKVKEQTFLINPYNTIKWNMDKHYLKDLEEKGITIIPTRFFEIGDKRTLEEISGFNGAERLILKPAVSGGSRHTYVLTRDNIQKHGKIFSELIQSESMLLQPFIESILSRGEASHIFFNGHYSHSILKKAKPGDFRVQDQWGGTFSLFEASPDDISFSEEVLSSCREMPVYARVDHVWLDSGESALAELEVIEPELWFRTKKGSADILADAVVEILKNIS